MSAIFAQKPIGPLASLDVTWRHVHRMLRSRHTRDWCIQFWSMLVQLGTPKAYFFKINLRQDKTYFESAKSDDDEDI